MPKFLSDVVLVNEAYGVGWNGSLEAATKDALYDKIETLSAGGSTETVLMTTGSETRPSTSGPVLWVGTPTPVNAINGDVWIDPDELTDTTNETIIAKSAGLISGTGTGTVNYVHDLGTTDVTVNIRRVLVPGGTTFPLGDVSIRWDVVDVDTIVLDFDTYSRVANEFRVVVMG